MVETSTTLDGTPWETVAVQDAGGDWTTEPGVQVVVNPAGNGRSSIEVRVAGSEGEIFVRLRARLAP